MDLFFTPPHRIDLEKKTLSIEGDEFFHMVKVLRKRKGEVIHLTDGEGLSVEAAIMEIGRGALTAAITRAKSVVPEQTRVTVAMSLLKSSQRFDFFLEKATELGVTGVVPMITGRTVSQPKAGRTGSKMQRWKKVLVSASLQSKRYRFPRIAGPLQFEEVLRLDGYDMKLMPYESSGMKPGASFTGKNVLFIVGGEGGFTGEEVERARESGFTDISFGRSILRAETAGVFAVAMVRSHVVANDGPEKWM